MAIFTPDNEPYLGRPSVFAFDNLITASLSANQKIAPITRRPDRTSLQDTACQLIPSGFSLALSVRELIRQGYLYGALVLDRPLAERAITVLYLYHFPEKQELWQSGWKYNQRPSLARMLNEIGGDKFPDVGREITRHMNSLIHGDPDSAYWNMIALEDGSFAHPVSKVLHRPDLCDRAASTASAWLSVLVAMALTIFPVERT